MSEVNYQSSALFTLEQAKALLQQQSPNIIVPSHASPLTPEEAANGYSTVTMVFDRPVHLTIETNRSIYFPQGVHEVPEHLADHWYLEANGARPHVKRIIMPAKTIPATAKLPPRQK